MDENLYELLGLDDPEKNGDNDTAEKDKEPADGDLIDEENDENTEEDIDDATDDDGTLSGEESDDADEGKEDSDGDKGKESVSAPDSKSADPNGALPNSVYAAARRKAEAEAQKKVEAMLDAQIAQLGMVNPYTGQPIKTRAEFEEYKTRYEREREEEELAKSGLSREALDRLIGQHPAVKQVQTVLQAMEREREAKRQEEARRALESDLANITALDPAIKTLEDLPKMENFDRFTELVRRGYKIDDAYRVVNFDKLVNRRAATAADAAAQKARNNGKDHLRHSGQRGTGMDPVPADVEKEFLALNPSATKAEIQAYYNKYKQSRK